MLFKGKILLMTKQSAEVFLGYLIDLSRDANMTPNDMGFMTYSLDVIVEHGKIFEIRIKGSEGKIRPQ